MSRAIVALLIIAVGVYPMVPPVDVEIPEPPEVEEETLPENATDQISVSHNLTVYQHEPGDHDARANVQVHNAGNETYSLQVEIVPVSKEGYQYTDKDKTVYVDVEPHSTEIDSLEWDSYTNIENSFHSLEIVRIEVCEPGLFTGICSNKVVE